MTDNLISRVKRLVSGGVNNIVDVVENVSPETIMKEALREVDTAIDQVRHELGEVIASKHLANRRLLETGGKHDDLSEKINIALAQQRDDLAEAAIARQLDIESQIPIMESAISDASNEEAELEKYVLALQARKREMEEELSTFMVTQRTVSFEAAEGNASSVYGNSASQLASKADQAFNRVMNQASGVAGVVSPDPKTARQLAELEQISRENRIHERLAMVKARLGKDGE